ncbi:hypothetical protein T4B_15265 [Trichinella pseudospiralis]|uniref:Uncharacterized protein n=2 Tax=Trichinella pseudospiralis TaxID=6337 RepID=A0A0V1ILF9_TRIPS|nr:hypothetical protein T4E_5585 [Trichinella pseudospiralis]KRY71242.1 hypothetical protein T4A_4107 [Trichinella pseudospiralis]KRY88251.1 hypothetical protein T4D_6388 [Trichinella pseudospiralis]KRZ23600.1 hypothetical protein T4B_15265 [Trichinella pseudospiralis]KRZ37132.1 hypothetical protein T4C_11224 [Trichinella pseudospiralis]
MFALRCGFVDKPRLLTSSEGSKSAVSGGPFADGASRQASGQTYLLEKLWVNRIVQPWRHSGGQTAAGGGRDVESAMQKQLRTGVPN